jgi:tetratricopeptide (TPR) repeat protein
MAPEQLQGTTVDARADIFALGCVLFEMVTGRRAFSRPTATETLAAILSAPVPEASATGTDAPSDLGRVIARCLEKQPGQRFQSASDLAFALRALLTGSVSAVASTSVPTSGPQIAPPAGERAVAASRSAPWRRVFAGVGLVLVVVAAITSVTWWRARTPPPSAAGGLDPQKVVVAVFDNRTGDASLDTLGVMVSAFVTPNLRRISGIKVADNPLAPAAGVALPRSTIPSGADPLRWLAERTGAGLVVAGAYYLDGAAIRMQCGLLEVAGMRIVDLEPVAGPRDTPHALVDLLTQRVGGAVATRLDKAFAGMTGAARAPRYDAYLEYLLGLKTFSTNYSATIEHMKKAVELDPTFVSAHVFLAFAYSNQGRFADADSVARPLEEPAFFSKATPSEQAMIQYVRAVINGSAIAEVAASREMVRQMPGSRWSYLVGLSEQRLHHDRAAIEAYARVTPEIAPADIGPGASWALANRAAIHHYLGEYEIQLDLARQGYRSYPNDGAFYSEEVAALVGLGRLNDIDNVLARFEKAPLRSDSRLGALMYNAMRELFAHGYREAGTAMAARGLAWYKNRIDAGGASRSDRAQYAAMLFRAGDCSTAIGIRRQLAHEAPDDIGARSSLGVLLAACGGSRDEARKIADALGQVKGPYVRGDQHMARAAVLAALGDREGAMRALQTAFAEGAIWSAAEFHRGVAFESLRDYPPFIELMKPKG